MQNAWYHARDTVGHKHTRGVEANVSFDERYFPSETDQSMAPRPHHSYNFHVTSRASRSELFQEASLTTIVL